VGVKPNTQFKKKRHKDTGGGLTARAPTKHPMGEKNLETQCGEANKKSFQEARKKIYKKPRLKKGEKGQLGVRSLKRHSQRGRTTSLNNCNWWWGNGGVEEQLK